MKTREQLEAMTRNQLIGEMKEAKVKGWYRIYNKEAMVEALLASGTSDNRVPFDNESGKGATGCYWTDCYAYEVVREVSEKQVIIRRLIAEKKPGTDWLDQEYNYYSDANAPEVRVRKCKNGWRTSNGMRVSFNGAREYRDPSF